MARTARLKLLTAMAVKAYVDDPNQTKPLHDGGGLYLRKREASARWYLRLTEPSTGADQWHVLFPNDAAGSYPHKGLANARDEADKLRTTRSKGLDPRAERARGIRERHEAVRRNREVEALEIARQLTVRVLFTKWRMTKLQPHIDGNGKRTGRKDGGKYVSEQFERHVFPTIGDTPLTDLRKADFLALLDAQTSAGKKRTANVLLTDLKQMLDFAVERDHITYSQLATTKRSKIGGAGVERDRVLTEIEVKLLPKALTTGGMKKRSALAVWVALATGVRVGELMGAVWSDDLPDEPKARQSRLDILQRVADADEVKLGVVNRLACTWYLADTKNQRDHTIHLSKFAVAQFDKLAALREVAHGAPAGTLSPWVFPARDNQHPVCVKSFGKQLSDRQREPNARMKHRSKATASLALPNGRWTAHDLRRTAATFMARLGFGIDTINECLNHMQADRMARVYIQDRREADQARAFESLGEKLAGLAEEAAAPNFAQIT
jgi:integrase